MNRPQERDMMVTIFKFEKDAKAFADELDEIGICHHGVYRGHRGFKVQHEKPSQRVPVEELSTHVN